LLYSQFGENYQIRIADLQILEANSLRKIASLIGHSIATDAFLERNPESNLLVL